MTGVQTCALPIFLSKDDLMEAMTEYPEAKVILEDKGREILLRDGLLDLDPANIMPDTKDMEEKVDRMYSTMELMQMKLKKLLGDYTVTDQALLDRIALMERLTGEEAEEEDEQGVETKAEAEEEIKEEGVVQFSGCG